MGESAELTQIQHDDQSHIVSFPKLDKRETAPAASHWHRVGAKPKQHTKVNQQAHSTPLKLTLPLKNRFLPLQESTNAPATHSPLSPEMRPDGQCGQRRKNQSPRRRAVHVSATVQQGPISEKADEPDTLIIGDSTIKDITVGVTRTLPYPTRHHSGDCSVAVPKTLAWANKEVETFVCILGEEDVVYDVYVAAAAIDIRPTTKGTVGSGNATSELSWAISPPPYRTFAIRSVPHPAVEKRHKRSDPFRTLQWKSGIRQSRATFAFKL
ncbi:unnamed protein product [Boreogadus saida]